MLIVVFWIERLVISLYLGDKNQRVTVRFNSDLFDFIVFRCSALNCSPSEYLRKLVLNDLVSYRERSVRRENETKPNIH